MSKIILSILFIAFSFSSFAQEVSVNKKDGRIIANIKGVTIPHILDKTVDPQKFMESFDIRIQWWSLLSEPVEKYDFTWYSTGSFTIDGTTIYRSSLQKCPKLLRDFDNLQPYKVWVFVEGDVTGKRISVKRGSVPNHPLKTRRLDSFKRNGQSYDRYMTSGDFIYLIEHLKILPTNSGRVGDGIIGGSPHWNEFLFWDDDSYSFSSNSYLKGKKSDKTLFSNNKRKFSSIQSVTLNAKLHKVEWFDSELRNIVSRYDKCEEEEEDDTQEKDDESEFDDFLNGGDQKNSDSGKFDDFLSGEGAKVVESNEGTKRNQNLGEVEVNTKKIYIKYRDHGQVDGDRIRLLHNLKVVNSNSTLASYFKTTTIDLEKGTNRIEFEALNQGSAGDNTALFEIEDENGDTIYTNEWSISTGYKGILLIIRN